MLLPPLINKKNNWRSTKVKSQNHYTEKTQLKKYWSQDIYKIFPPQVCRHVPQRHHLYHYIIGPLFCFPIWDSFSACVSKFRTHHSISI